MNANSTADRQRNRQGEHGGQSYGKHSDGAILETIEGSGAARQSAGSRDSHHEGGDSMSHTVKHKADCRRVFNRYDMDCARCRQLAAGDKARPGWGNLRRKAEAQRLQAIANHDFAACMRANVVCTHFEH